jgi:predicted kinase
MKQLTLMIGIAGSGKSTFVNENLTKRNQVLCLDDIRLALGSTYEPRHEPVVYMVTDIQTRALMERGLSIVIDATCCQLFVVKKYKKLAEEYGYQLIGIYIDTSFEKCVERREGQIPLDKMMKQNNDLNELMEVKDDYFDKFIIVNDKGNKI